MASRSKSDKYWLANCPNGEVTDAQVVALKGLSETDISELENIVADLDHLNIPMAAEADAAAAGTLADLAAAEAKIDLVKDKVNNLLGKLRTAGLLAS